jgi:hypothetical protein
MRKQLNQWTFCELRINQLMPNALYIILLNVIRETKLYLLLIFRFTKRRPSSYRARSGHGWFEWHPNPILGLEACQALQSNHARQRGRSSNVLENLDHLLLPEQVQLDPIILRVTGVRCWIFLWTMSWRYGSTILFLLMVMFLLLGYSIMKTSTAHRERTKTN